MLLGNVVPAFPHSLVGRATAVLVSTRSVAARSPIKMGLADHTSATTPATCGVAIDVPLRSCTVPPGQVDGTATPGALISGLIRPSLVGPRDEKVAIRSSGSVAP